MPETLTPRFVKLNISLFETVSFELATEGDEPPEKMRLTGTPVVLLRSRIWLSAMVSLSLPVVAPVLKKTTPALVLDSRPSMKQLRMVSFEASLTSVKVAPVLMVLRKRRKRPAPLNRPSKVTRFAPLRRIMPPATLPEIVLRVAESG